MSSVDFHSDRKQIDFRKSTYFFFGFQMTWGLWRHSPFRKKSVGGWRAVRILHDSVKEIIENGASLIKLHLFFDFYFIFSIIQLSLQQNHSAMPLLHFTYTQYTTSMMTPCGVI